MIYVIEADFSRFKIGYTGAKSGVKKRLSALRVGNPEKLNLLLATEGDRSDEQAIHNLLRKFRENGEWFSKKRYMDHLFDNVINLLAACDAKFVLSHTEDQLRNFCSLPGSLMPQLDYAAMGVVLWPMKYMNLTIENRLGER